MMQSNQPGHIHEERDGATCRLRNRFDRLTVSALEGDKVDPDEKHDGQSVQFLSEYNNTCTALSLVSLGRTRRHGSGVLTDMFFVTAYLLYRKSESAFDPRAESKTLFHVMVSRLSYYNVPRVSPPDGLFFGRRVCGGQRAATFLRTFGSPQVFG